MGQNLQLWTPAFGDFLLTAEVLQAILGGGGGSGGGGISQTAITTVGNGTLTAAALLGGQIARTGPTGAFTDTTDTVTIVAGDQYVWKITNNGSGNSAGIQGVSFQCK